MPLLTLPDLKVHLGVTGSADDDLLTKLQDTADNFIAIHCGRDFEGGSFTEAFAGGSRLLILRNYPVTALTSLKVDTARLFGVDTEREPNTYVVHSDRGVVENLQGLFVPWVEKGAHPKSVLVEYDTAEGSVPAAVAWASADLVGFWYRQTKTHTDCDQLNVLEKTEDEITTRHPWGQSGGYRIPLGILEALAPYRGARL